MKKQNDFDLDLRNVENYESTGTLSINTAFHVNLQRLQLK